MLLVGWAGLVGDVSISSVKICDCYVLEGKFSTYATAKNGSSCSRWGFAAVALLSKWQVASGWRRGARAAAAAGVMFGCTCSVGGASQ